MTSTCDILIEGRNQSVLLERLKKHGVSVYKINIINDKKLIINIKCSDIRKVFEISENMWYNKLIKYHGPKKAWIFIKNNALILLSALVFIVGAFVIDNFVLGIDLENVPKNYRSRVEAIVKSQGIDRFSAFSDVDYADIKAKILSVDGVGYAQVEKKGYRLFVTVKPAEESESEKIKTKNIVSDVGGVIKSVTVYRGRALKSVGDTVCAGEVLVDGTVNLPDETVYDGYCQALVTVETAITEEYQSADSGEYSVTRAVAAARLNVGGEDCRCEAEVVPVGEQFIIRVTVYRIVAYGEG